MFPEFSRSEFFAPLPQRSPHLAHFHVQTDYELTSFLGVFPILFLAVVAPAKYYWSLLPSADDV